MATPSPTPSPPSDSNPNHAATPPHQNPPPSNSTAIQTPPSPQTTVVALAASTSAVARKTQPVLWTEDETLLLIDSYKQKWYAVGRGPLRSNQWEEISVAVSGRSGVERSATQCRHKMEKLRKRFKAERQSMGPISIWPFYSQMDELDCNPAPISARPLTRLPPMRRPGTVNRFAGVGGGLAFAEKTMVMEKKKMEFAKETLKLRKDMEIKRLKLIQTSQAQLLQFLNTSFASF
ncbi:Homeodomain-like superfamily protein [Raphanus sativus]|nr:Homeodomain-like superfamily protein [Raphanus sativus]